MTHLTHHFSIAEMSCPCCQKCEMNPKFMTELEDFHRLINKPLIVNSGYRCAKHNDEIKGSVSNSEHLRGNAADIRWAADKFIMVRIAMAMFNGIGIGRTYIHVDLGLARRLWIY